MRHARVAVSEEAGGFGAWIKANGGKLALLLILLGAAGSVFWFNGGPKSPLSDHIAFVCVTSGKVFYLPRGETRIMPFKNPETGQETLFPCVKQDDGKFYVSSRYREGIGRMGDANKAIDPKTLEVKKVTE